MLFLLALLVGDAAGGLARGLAGGLALAAAALLGALAEAAGLQGLNSLHTILSYLIKFEAIPPGFRIVIAEHRKYTHELAVQVP